MSKISTTQKQTVKDNYNKLGDLFRRDKSWEYHKSGQQQICRNYIEQRGTGVNRRLVGGQFPSLTMGSY